MQLRLKIAWLKKYRKKNSFSIRKEIEEKYSNSHIQKPLWERLKDTKGIHNPYGWKMISSFPIKNRIILFFDKEETEIMYYVNTNQDLVKLIEECPGFVFYLTDDNLSFLICYNDHDYLIASGQAQSMVKNLEKETFPHLFEKKK